MVIKFYIDRYVMYRGWVRVTSGLGSLEVAENMKETLAQRYHEDVDNFSIVVAY